MRASQYRVSQFNLKCIKYYQEPCSTFRKGKKIMLVPTLHPDRISSLFLSRAVPRAACTLHGSHGDRQQSQQDLEFRSHQSYSEHVWQGYPIGCNSIETWQVDLHQQLSEVWLQVGDLTDANVR